MLPQKLDFLFVADFFDGSRYFQNPNDASVRHPLTRSAFYDVAQRLDQVKVFTLIDRHRQHEHAVFLEDGHFKSDGHLFLPDPKVGEMFNFRLIYFRRCQVPQVMGARGVDFEPHKVVGYFIGWQANDAAGRNHKLVLRIPPLGSLEKPEFEP